MITEMDVLDDGLKADPATRDAAGADVYRRYLDVALVQAFADAPPRVALW